MKQLLHTSTDGCHIVVALHDTVYYYDHRKCRGTVYELSSHSNASIISNDNCNNEKDTTSSVATNQNQKNKAPIPEPVDPHEVQAVAIATTTNNLNHSTIWCAVARYDKSLTLYSWEETTAPSEDNETSGDSSSLVVMKVIPPYATHHTAKRVSSLAFATVPGPTTATDPCPDLTVIVAGDVVGDANAYSLQPTSPVGGERHDENDDGDGDDVEMPDQIVTKHRRLLLGHTASMLTSVHIVTESTTSTNGSNMNDIPLATKRQFILTSDRDEKIRVSRFPDTFCIEGYLLGHTAFVSSVAPIPLSSSSSSFVSSGRNCCVSVGGDCTIRLWDYSTCHELAVASTDLESVKTETEENKSVMNHDETDRNEAVESGSGDHSTPTGPIPTKVAVATDGSVITTIYDECLTIDFWLIRSDNNNASDDSDDCNCTLDRIFRWTCPGQPFGMAFLDDKHFVLVMQEPHYMQQFKIICNGETAGTTIIDVVAMDSSPCRTIQQLADERDILMTDALLEKDEYGCLIMGKMNERRGGAAVHPWNNFSRRETYADRLRRFRNRRREERLQQQQQLEESSPT